MTWDDIPDIVKGLTGRTPKERAERADHIFILVASIELFKVSLDNVTTLSITNLFEAVVLPVIPYFLAFGVLLMSFPLCKFAVNKFI